MARKNSVLYTNGEVEKYFSEGEEIPSGFVKSKVIYINNGIDNKRWIEGKQLPEGFVVGKLPLSRNWTPDQHKHHSQQTKDKISAANKGKRCGEENSFYGKHHTQETRKLLSEQHSGKPAPNKGVKLTEEQKINRDRKLIDKYGSLEEFYSQTTLKAKQTKLERYGDANYNNREKCAKTTLENYGVPYYCMTDEYRKGHGNKSAANDNFKYVANVYNIPVGTEFCLQSYLYDFKHDNILIEINPAATHNSTYGVYNDPPKDMLYHFNKTKTAV